MILTAKDLTKKFGGKVALDSVSFSIGRKEIIGLIGPNGSGKTTMLNIFMGILHPSSGHFEIASDAKIGMSVSRAGFFDDMSVINNIRLQMQLAGAADYDVSEVMAKFSIDFEKERFGKLSAGMKQRVSLITSFFCQHDLIFLDEPSNHLDIDSILALRSMILSLKEKGVSFLITSHILSDLEKVCDRILFLRNGKILGDETTAALMQKYGKLEDAYLDILKQHVA